MDRRASGCPRTTRSGRCRCRRRSDPRSRNRATSPTWPRMIAAPTSPIPKISVSVVPDAATATAMRRAERLALGVEPLELVEQLDGEGVPFDGHRADRLGARRGAIGPGKQRLPCRSRPAPGPPPAHGADTPSCCRPSPAGCAGATTAAAPWRGPRPAPGPARRPAARRSRPTGRRSGRSSPSGPCPTAAPATPASRGCRRPVRRRRGAAGPAGSRARRRTRSPTIRSPPSRRLAHSNSSGTCLPVARTSRSSSTRSAVSIATAVWVRLCGSMPIMTIADPPIIGMDRGGHS